MIDKHDSNNMLTFFLTLISLVTVIIILATMTECVKQYNTEQAAIQLAHEIK